MKGIVVALLVVMLIPTANGQLTQASDFCEDSQTLIHNVTLTIADDGDFEEIEIINREHCPYGCVEKFQFTSNTTLVPGQCAKGPLESAMWMGGIIILILVVGTLVVTQIKVF